jgi:MSHA biogenesis protein MshO
MGKSRTSGFTLVELILVIVVLGIVGIATTSYLGLGAQMYADAAGRDQLLSQSRFAIERLTRELRNVVPNSVRTWNNGQCIEFAPLLQAGRYEGSLVSPTTLFSTANWGTLVANTLALMTVYPVNAGTDIYLQQRVASMLSLTVNPNPRLLNVTFTFPGNVVPNSPSQRMYFMTPPVAYCVVGTTLLRYQRASIESVAGANLPTGVLMAENIDLNFYTDPNPDIPVFSFENSVVLTRNAVVHIRLAFRSNFNDTLVFNQEIHIPNVP